MPPNWSSARKSMIAATTAKYGRVRSWQFNLTFPCVKTSRNYPRGRLSMVEDIMRFEGPVSATELADILSGSATPTLQKTGTKANLVPVENTFRKLAAQTKTEKRDYDIAMCEVLHKQLKHLP